MVLGLWKLSISNLKDYPGSELVDDDGCILGLLPLVTVVAEPDLQLYILGEERKRYGIFVKESPFSSFGMLLEVFPLVCTSCNLCFPVLEGCSCSAGAAKGGPPGP
ncbi:hypothetical protein Bca4012_020417 [Brassica carinata]